jgi:hypothetical protein
LVLNVRKVCFSLSLRKFSPHSAETSRCLWIVVLPWPDSNLIQNRIRPQRFRKLSCKHTLINHLNFVVVVIPRPRQLTHLIKDVLSFLGPNRERTRTSLDHCKLGVVKLVGGVHLDRRNFLQFGFGEFWRRLRLELELGVCFRTVLIFSRPRCF